MIRATPHPAQRAMRLGALCFLLALLPLSARAQSWQIPAAASPPSESVPALSAEQRAAAAHELRAVETRLEPLLARRRKLSLGLPIAMMATGLATLAIGGLVAAEAGARSSYDEDVAARVFGIFAVPAAILMVGGAVFLGVRVHRRRQDNPVLRELQLRKRRLESQLSYLPPGAPGSLGSLTLRGTF